MKDGKPNTMFCGKCRKAIFSYKYLSQKQQDEFVYAHRACWYPEESDEGIST